MDSYSGIVIEESRRSEQFSDFTPIPCKGFNLLCKAKRYGRWWVLKGLKKPYRQDENYKNLLHKEFDIQPIRNTGSEMVKGSDYSVEITIMQSSTGVIKAKKVHQGVDLASGESTIFSDDIPELYNYAYNKDISCNTNIIVKDQDTVKESLLKKIDYNGQEYEEFLKAKKEGKFNAADITDDDGSPQDEPDPNYKEPSEDIPTEIPSDVVVDTVPRNR